MVTELLNILMSGRFLYGNELLARKQALVLCVRVCVYVVTDKPQDSNSRWATLRLVDCLHIWRNDFETHSYQLFSVKLAIEAETNELYTSVDYTEEENSVFILQHRTLLSERTT